MTTTHTVAVPGATLTYDLHPAEGTPADPTPLVLIGSPMDASGFTTLRTHLTDRALVTYDPRNTGRSERDEPTAAVTPEQHADDLHAVLEAARGELGVAGPVDLFASSGGAVNALALVAAYPDDLRMLVAHEPPLGSLLPDSAVIDAVCAEMVAGYDAGGFGPFMARFIAFVMQRGPVAATYLDGPAPDPASFGLPATDDGSRDDPMASNMRGGGATWTPDVAAVRAAPTRVVPAVGEESGGPDDGEMPGRSAYALATALGVEATVMPGGHSGFLGGEFGQTGRPVEFAERLRAVLAVH